MGNNCSCTDAADKDQEIRTDAVINDEYDNDIETNEDKY